MIENVPIVTKCYKFPCFWLVYRLIIGIAGKTRNRLKLLFSSGEAVPKDGLRVPETKKEVMEHD
jgi:hypothetical protein